jgi:hypothetical protein
MIACFKQHMNLDEGIVRGLKLSQRVPPPFDKGKGASNKMPVEEPKTSEKVTKKTQKSPSFKQKLHKCKHIHTETSKQKRGRSKKRTHIKKEEEEDDDKKCDDEPDATRGSLTRFSYFVKAIST